MREVKVITPSADEERYYRGMVEPIIRRRYLKPAETEEQTGLINPEYWMRAVQQLMNEEALPIITMKPNYDPKQDKQLQQPPNS